MLKKQDHIGDGNDNHKNIGFLSKTGPDLLKNHKVTKPAINVGPSARQRNPAYIGISFLPSSTQKIEKEKITLSKLDSL